MFNLKVRQIEIKYIDLCTKRIDLTEMNMKKLVRNVMMAACAGMCLVSCGNGQSSLSVSSLNGEWTITTVGGEKISAEDMPFIGFNVAEKRMYGNSGCNRMMGSLVTDSLKPSALKFDQVGSTRMMCPDMNTEEKVLGAINQVASFQAVDGKDNAVALCGADGKVLLTLEKKEAAAPVADAADLNGEWLVEVIGGQPVGKSEKAPFLGFNLAENKIYGCAGCNNIHGMLVMENTHPNALKFDQVGATMMMCPDMTVETNMLKALSEVQGYQLADGKLSLLGEAGNELMVLKKK